MTRVGRIKREFEVKMAEVKKLRAKEKEKSDRKKELSKMSKEKKKKSEETSERKKKVSVCCVCWVLIGDVEVWFPILSARASSGN